MNEVGKRGETTKERRAASTNKTDEKPEEGGGQTLNGEGISGRESGKWSPMLLGKSSSRKIDH